MDLESSLDLSDHLFIFCFRQIDLAGVHGEGRTPFEFTLVLGNQMEVQVAATVAVGAVVDLIGGECLVDGIGSMGHICKEKIALFLRNVHQLADRCFTAILFFRADSGVSESHSRLRHPAPSCGTSRRNP